MLVLLERYGDWKFQRARKAEEAIQLLGESNDCGIDLVLLDLMSPGESGLSLIEHVRALPRSRDTRVIVISGVSDRAVVAKTSIVGADAYVLKSSAESELFEIIDTVLCGGRNFALLGEGVDAPSIDESSLGNLSSRQKEVLDLIMGGSTNKQIASLLGLSYGTVKNYVYDIMRSMRVSGRGELVTAVQREGYLPKAGANDLRKCV
jgi:two-component system nitrate/nitrite response regulator NarL